MLAPGSASMLRLAAGPPRPLVLPQQRDASVWLCWDPATQLLFCYNPRHHWSLGSMSLTRTRLFNLADKCSKDLNAHLLFLQNHSCAISTGSRLEIAWLQVAWITSWATPQPAHSTTLDQSHLETHSFRSASHFLQKPWPISAEIMVDLCMLRCLVATAIGQ